MKKNLKKIIEAGAAGSLFQGTVVPLQTPPSAGVPGFQPLTNAQNAPMLAPFFNGNNSSLAGFFNAAFTLALSLGAILAVLQLARAGWMYMSSDAFGEKSHAKEVIVNAILGLALLVGIYIILYQINPCILNLNVLQEIQNGSPGQCAAASSNSGVPQTIAGGGGVPAGTENLNGTAVNQFNQPLQ